MIEFLRGEIKHKKDDIYIIDLGTVALRFRSPSDLQDQSVVFIELFIKDDRIELYGFKTPEEREIFNRLLSINGVGIKHAFSILRSFSPERFFEIVEKRDITTLTTAQGVGKKTAQRIILELQDKLDFMENELFNDLVDALTGLGFDKKKALSTAKEVLKDTDNLEKALKLALQKLAEKG
ncbi:Holliday junction branch migration protein RuvA [Persephonella sp.]